LRLPAVCVQLTAGFRRANLHFHPHLADDDAVRIERVEHEVEKAPTRNVDLGSRAQRCDGAKGERASGSGRHLPEGAKHRLGGVEDRQRESLSGEVLLCRERRVLEYRKSLPSRDTPRAGAVGTAPTTFCEAGGWAGGLIGLMNSGEAGSSRLHPRLQVARDSICVLRDRALIWTS